MSAQDIDQELIGLHLRVLLSHCCKAFVPKRHREDDTIGLRGRSDMVLASASEFERILHDPIATLAGEHILLNRHLKISVAMQPPSDFGVFSFIVLADNDEIYLARPPVPQRTRHPFQKLDGTNVGVLFETSTNRDQ